MKIKFEGLSKEFQDGKQILKSMNFCDDIHTLAIIGPSGGGKSTLLRILGGLIAPTSGRIWIDGEELSFDETSLHNYRKKIAFVFQQSGLFKHMTALENITVPLVQVHGYTKEAAFKRAMELLTRLGLNEDADKKPSALSGGQKQRIAIARAIAPKPKLLLLDEPTSALDPEYTNEVLDLVNELKNEGIDFIIVTHEMGFARHACDKAAFLSNGTLMEFGKSEDIFLSPKTDHLQKFLSRLLEWNM